MLQSERAREHATRQRQPHTATLVTKMDGVQRLRCFAAQLLLGLAILAHPSGTLAATTSAQGAEITTTSVGTEITISGGGSNPLFPPFSRCDRDMTHAPYRVAHAPDPDRSLVCFAVDVAPCDARWKCCSMELHKFEVAVHPAAKHHVKAAYVDGARRAFEFHAKLKVLRVADLGRTPANATGTRICFKTEGLADALTGLCRPAAWSTCVAAVFNAGRRDCCPVTLYAPPAPPAPRPPAPPPPPPRPSPPPAPPPPAGFPFRTCDRRTGPVTLSPPTSHAQPDGTVRHCFSVLATGAPPGACGAMDLYKIEFDVKGSCAGALSYATVNGVKRPPFFQTKPFPAVKVNNLNLTAQTAPGTIVCLALKAPCATLDQLCAGGSCPYALFNSPVGHDFKCCPLGVMPATRPY